MDESDTVRAVALVPDGGGYRLVVAVLPASVLEDHAQRVSEPDVLTVQLPLAAEALEEGARGGSDGVAARAACPSCGRAALVRHPSKGVWLCAACGYRGEAVAVAPA